MPTNLPQLWQTWTVGEVRFKNQPEKRFDWASSLYYDGTIFGTPEDAAPGLAEAAFNRWAGFAMPPSYWGADNWLMYAEAIHVQTGTSATFGFDWNLSQPDQVKPVPPQAAWMIVGLTSKLGRQTRKWVAGLSIDTIDNNTGFPLGDASMKQWALELMTDPYDDFFTGSFWFPMHYSEQDDTLDFFTEIKMQKEWRTIRRRSLDQSELLPTTV